MTNSEGLPGTGLGCPLPVGCASIRAGLGHGHAGFIWGS